MGSDPLTTRPSAAERVANDLNPVGGCPPYGAPRGGRSNSLPIRGLTGRLLGAPSEVRTVTRGVASVVMGGLTGLVPFDSRALWWVTAGDGEVTQQWETVLRWFCGRRRYSEPSRAVPGE